MESRMKRCCPITGIISHKCTCIYKNCNQTTKLQTFLPLKGGKEMGKSKSKDKEREKENTSSVKQEKDSVNLETKQERSPNRDISSVVEDDSFVKEEKDTIKQETDRPDYSELIKYVTVISKPLASRKLTKRLYKTVKKASKVKTVRRGVKEVVKAIRKGEKGIVVIAGDVTPIDVISHFPVMCEDRDLPYCYVPSKVDLGTASLTKRPTSIVMVKNHAEIGDNYEKCFSEVKALPLPI